MSNFSDELLNKTIQAWQKDYDHPLSLEDAREIAGNTAELFKLLDVLDKKYHPPKLVNKIKYKSELQYEKYSD